MKRLVSNGLGRHGEWRASSSGDTLEFPGNGLYSARLGGRFYLGRQVDLRNGALGEQLRGRLEKKKRELATAERELSGRKTETWAAVGTALLSNIGLLRGRKRTLTGAGTVLSKNRMENQAEGRVEALRTEVADLEKQLTALVIVEPSRFEERAAVPSRSDVKLLRWDLVWV